MMRGPARRVREPFRESERAERQRETQQHGVAEGSRLADHPREEHEENKAGEPERDHVPTVSMAAERVLRETSPHRDATPDRRPREPGGSGRASAIRWGRPVP